MKRSTFSIFLLLPMAVFCQQPTHDLPRIALKTNVLSLLDPAKSSANLAVDFGFPGDWGADLELGYFFDSQRSAAFKGETYAGLRLRACGKHFLAVKNRSDQHVGLEFRFNDIRNKTTDQWLRQGQQYIQNLFTVRKVRSVGYVVRYGVRIFEGERRRFFWEWDFALGANYHNVVREGVPSDAERVSSRIFDFEYPDGRSKNPVISIGLLFGVVLR